MNIDGVGLSEEIHYISEFSDSNCGTGFAEKLIR